MRKFHLVRDMDITGVSGTGTVAEGVLLTNGVAILSWRGHFSSVAMYMKGIPEIEHIHGHNGATRVVWQEFLMDGAESVHDLADAIRRDAGVGSAFLSHAVEDIAAVYSGALSLEKFREQNGLCPDNGGHFTEDCKGEL